MSRGARLAIHIASARLIGAPGRRTLATCAPAVWLSLCQNSELAGREP